MVRTETHRQTVKAFSLDVITFNRERGDAGGVPGPELGKLEDPAEQSGPPQ
jgi:hypothetical protein